VGRTRLIRYADDFVVCFQEEAEANRFRQELTERLAEFGLEVAPSKTRVLAFGPWQARQARAQGERPGTFDFLGFTHYCAPTRDGKRFRVKRMTSRHRFTAKLKAFKLWLKTHRILPTRDLMAIIQAKLRGHIAYYGVTDNSEAMQRFLHEVRMLLFKWLNRRGGRKPLGEEKFARLMAQFPLPKARVVVSLF
jgi:RNA-directed DNA polymerase